MHQVCDVINNGQEAVARAVRHLPDLILMDIMLAGDMNGIEAAEHIGKEFDVPIIYLSCLSHRLVLKQAVQTHPYGYLLKPYDPTELRLSIDLALIRHQSAKERAMLIGELKKALGEVKRLSGLLPICAACKKIRDEQGRWQVIEMYISAHSEADFTHGICPECARQLYPELYPAPADSS